MALREKRKAVYLDVCALCRPFDDQDFLRIRIEADAVNLILSKAREGRYRILVSPAHHKEMEAIVDQVERMELQTLLLTLGEPVRVNADEARKRAEELVKAGFGVADAAHVALAEHLEAVFISCDEKLLIAFCEKEGLK